MQGVPSAEVVEVGIDYLTATQRDPVFRGQLYEVGKVLIEQESESGNRQRPFEWMGYEGVACGSVATGWRSDGVILRLSGRLAAEYGMIVYPLVSNISRLDLQVTARQTEPTPDLGEKAEVLLIGKRDRRGKPLNIKMVRDNGRGNTLYVGKRSSDTYGRLYDKAVESPKAGYNDCWRWEVEYKSHRALYMAGALAEQAEARGSIQSTVWSYWEDRGLRPTWDQAESAPLPRYPARTTDEARRAKWLSTQVRPVVEQLAGQKGIPWVLKVLGLPN